MSVMLPQSLELKRAIVQAPMAGGATTPELVAAVSNAGALGSIGAGYLSPPDLKVAIQRTKTLTDHAFAVNLFVPEANTTTAVQLAQACDAINACGDALGCNVAPESAPYAPNFDEQVDVMLREKVAIFSFTFGIPDAAILSECHKRGVITIGTATTLEEAEALEAHGVHVICAQGSEAGGHRGSFIKKEEDSLVPLDTLLKQVVAQVSVPVIAAGGLMTGPDVNHVLELGAQAAQLGTAFLVTTEAGIADCYKEALLAQTGDTTTLTRAFSGKLARGIANHFTRCMADKAELLVEYPIQNKLTKSMRSQAVQCKNTEFMSLWAGQSVAEARQMSARDLVMTFANEYSDKE